MKKIKPPIAGLLQSLGVLIYCALVSGFFLLMQKKTLAPSGIMTSILILFLLVFSAAITGLLVFGYPVYLALNKKIKTALTVLGYTFLYCLGMIVIIIIIVALLAS